MNKQTALALIDDAIARSQLQHGKLIEWSWLKTVINVMPDIEFQKYVEVAQVKVDPERKKNA